MWGGVGEYHPPSEVFLSFFPKQLKLNIRTWHFQRLFVETKLVMISYYGYKRWRHKLQEIKPFLNENAYFFNFFQR